MWYSIDLLFFTETFEIFYNFFTHLGLDSGNSLDTLSGLSSTL